MVLSCGVRYRKLSWSLGFGYIRYEGKNGEMSPFFYTKNIFALGVTPQNVLGNPSFSAH